MGMGSICYFLLTALGDDAQAVVVEVFEAVSTALDEFHFAVEAFGDAIVSGEAPHGGQGLAPGVEGLGESDQGSEGAGGELLNEEDEVSRGLEALAFGEVFSIHERAQGVHFFVERAETGMGLEEGLQADKVFGQKAVAALAEGGEDP